MYIEYIKRFAKPFSLRVCSHLIPILTSFRFETYLHHAVTHNTPKSETRAHSALQITAMLSIPISTDQTTLQGTSLFVSGQNNLEMFLPKPRWAHTHISDACAMLYQTHILFLLPSEARNSFMQCIIYNSWTTRRGTRRDNSPTDSKALSRWTNESWSSSQCLPKALRDSVFFFISPHCQYFSGAYSKTRTISCSQIRKYLHVFVAEWGHSHPFVSKLICIMLSHTTRLSQKQEHILLCKSQRC